MCRLFVRAVSVPTNMYTVRHPSLLSLCSTTVFRRWRSAGMETGMGLYRPTGCEKCCCPGDLQPPPSPRCPARPSRATPRRPASRSGPGGSGGRGCCSPPCSPSRRAAGRRSCHRSRRASARSSRPGASTSSPRPPRCCKTSSACGWPSPDSRKEALWGSSLQRDRRVRDVSITWTVIYIKIRHF